MVGSTGGIMTGLVISSTVTLMFDNALFPTWSVAVTVTTVIPALIIVPAIGF